MRGIAIREELTDEWSDRGAHEKKDYEILTAEISKATFDMTPNEYKKYKSLKKENLRDHMNDLELIFTMLGEKATTEITQNEDSHGMPKLKIDAKDGGDIAGNAKKSLEKKLGRTISSKKNYLKITESEQRKTFKTLVQESRKVIAKTGLKKSGVPKIIKQIRGEDLCT